MSQYDIILEEPQIIDEQTLDTFILEAIGKLIPRSFKKKLRSPVFRRQLLEKCGKKAYLLPDHPDGPKFPIMKEDCKPDCGLIYAARLRARSLAGRKPEYKKVAEKAEELYKKYNCEKKIGVEIKEAGETLDIETFIELVEEVLKESKCNCCE